MSTQPEALRLADALEQQFPIGTAQHYLDGDAAAELRRLHEEVKTLRDSCKAKADRIDRLGKAVERLTEMERNHARINGELREELKQNAAAEREACADILMRLHAQSGSVHNYFQFAANAVRERGQA